VIAYNRFARDIDRIAMQQDNFMEEFSNILARNANQSAHAAAPAAPVSVPGRF
jgi:biopolymer transport protein TolQ